MLNSNEVEKGTYVFVSRVKEFVALKERNLGRTIENREIAEETGISEHTVGTWMKPKEFRSADAIVVGALASYFGVEWYDLLVLRKTAEKIVKRRGRPSSRVE